VAESESLRVDGAAGRAWPVEAPPAEPPRELVEQVRELISRTIAVDVRDENEDLIENAVLDSLALVELLFELERRFDVVLVVGELNIENFRSVSRIARLVAEQRRRAAS
jgi:acyl carrier protein